LAIVAQLRRNVSLNDDSPQPLSPKPPNERWSCRTLLDCARLRRALLFDPLQL